MADVDLLVEVTNVGVAAAIANLEELRSKGLQTAQGTKQMAEAIEAGMAAIKSSTSGATTSFEGLDAAFSSTAAKSVSLKVALQSLQQSYKETAALNAEAGATPLDRLNAFSGANGESGRQAAEQARALQEAFNADPVRDLIAVEQQEAAVERERLALLEQQAVAQARQASGLASAATARTSAQQSLTRANEDLQNQVAGINGVQRATINLTRAQQDQTAAISATASARGRLQGSGATDVAKQQAYNAALNEQAAATRQVTAAQEQLAAAERGAQNEHANAFQSSFSYFIVAGLAKQVAGAITGIGGAAVQASSDINRSFADVERTFDGTSGQLDSLKAKLFELSTVDPISVTDLAQIAALGNQLGVASQNIESFTTTIAQYSAVSGVSAEDAATAFGKIGALTGLAASQYNNLGSAIEYVARTSVSTEAGIQSTAEEITAIAGGAGFSASAIVGLSGALASLSIPPERARGALSLYFGALNSAVAEGGPKLEEFATLTGLTSDKLSQLVENNQGQEVFTKFLQGLGDLNNVAKTTALDQLGLSTIRVDQTMRALSQNVGLVTDNLDGSANAFAQNNELQRQYAIIQATLASKVTEFQNAIQNAAGAVGNALAPALTGLLEVATNIIVGFTQFINTPYGQTIVQIAGAVGLLVAGIATLIGTLALAKASMVVFSFALNGLGWSSASKGLIGLVASLFSTDAATRSAAFSLTGLRVALAETSVGAAAAKVGLTALNATMGLLVIGAVIAAFSDLNNQINYADNQMKALGASSDELATAMQTDNPSVFAQKTSQAGDAAGTTTGQVVGLNAALKTAVETQLATADATDNTNAKLDAQTLKVGAATQEWIKNAVLQSDALKTLLESSNTDGGPNGAQTLQAAISGGLDINKFATIAYTSGSGAAEKYYQGWLTTLQQQAANGDPAAKKALAGQAGGFDLDNALLKPLAVGVQQAKVKGIIAAALTNPLGAAAADATPEVNGLGQALTDSGGAAIAAGTGYDGATSSLTAYQDAVQSGMKKFVDFNTILQQLEKQAQKDKGATKIDAPTFGSDLASSNKDATKFYEDLNKLGGEGATSFISQLASVGPAASNIAASALKLSGGARAKLEENSRYAAFLTSDAFKTALQTDMADSNNAYARIFEKTGNLSDVRSFIAAQVKGTGDEYEKQWDIQNPTLPLNVDFKNPSPAMISEWQQELSGRLTIKANVVAGKPTSKTYTDTETGANITLPAKLSGEALSRSLKIWQDNENASPKSISSKLNTDKLSGDLQAWVAAHGPITIRANIVPNKIPSPQFITPTDAHGGLLDSMGYGHNGANIARFATGGGFGMFQGPGTGTSDDILARVSRNEYINTADSTGFWGPGFFDSLNRKMLPTSFVSMLSAAAVSGNRGPSHVANVNVQLVNPLTRDPLHQLREESENVAAGIWG